VPLRRHVSESRPGEHSPAIERFIGFLLGDPLAHTSVRQLAVFLACYAEAEPQSVRALSRRLRIAWPSDILQSPRERLPADPSGRAGTDDHLGAQAEAYALGIRTTQG
jgi:hypothetical protein